MVDAGVDLLIGFPFGPEGELPAQHSSYTGAIEAKVMPLLREGRVKPLMDSTFPLEKAADAHRRMETSEHIGKIVLAV